MKNIRIFFLAVCVCVVMLPGCGRTGGIKVRGLSELHLQESEVTDADVAELSGQTRSAGYEDDDKESSETGKKSEKDAESTSPEQDGIAVYVRGAVKKPGVYYLQEGARVYQAIEKAGGFTEKADTGYLNQAKLLTDGEMLTVLTVQETSEMEAFTTPVSGAAASSSGGTGGTWQQEAGNTAGSAESASSGLVNLNTASQDELMTLPGIGEAKADSIIRYREENGPFASPEDVMNISGIKNSVFSKIKDKITV